MRILAVILLTQLVMTACTSESEESVEMSVGEDHTFVHDGMGRTYKNLSAGESGSQRSDGLCPAWHDVKQHLVIHGRVQ